MDINTLQYTSMTQSIENLTQTISARLKNLIDSRWEGSQDDLATVLGIHQTHVSALKRGTKLPSVPLLVSLVKVLDSNLDYVVGLTDDDKPASDLEDQVVVGVRDPEERQLLQNILDLVQAMPRQEQGFVLEVISRLANQNKPRIIG